MPETGGVGVDCPGYKVALGTRGAGVYVSSPGLSVAVGTPDANVYVG